MERCKTLCAARERLKCRIQNHRSLIRPTLILAAIFVVGISAILRANFYYVDDMGRAVLGYRGWSNYSRYLSSVLSRFLHTDSYLTDISPLPQLLASVLMALSGVLVLYVLSDRKQFSVWTLISMVPLGLSPYFLECMSYKFDAPYMAISVLSSIIPALFAGSGWLFYGLASVVGMLIVCTTYQASSGIFPMLVLLICLRRWNRGEKFGSVAKFGLISAVGYGIGAVIFKVFLMRPANSYVSNTIPGLGGLLPTIIENLKTYFGLILSDFKPLWLVLSVFLALSFVYVTVRDTKRSRPAALAMALAVLIVMALLSYGLYAVLQSPLYMPRGMYGFGAFLALLAAHVMLADRAFLSKALCLALCWVFFVYAFTYGNALFVQSQYTDFRITSVIQDMNDIELFASDEMKQVQISGSIDLSPALVGTADHFPMIRRTVPVTFSEYGDWGVFGFREFYSLRNIEFVRGIDLSDKNLTVLKDTMYHTISADGSFVLIELK